MPENIVNFKGIKFYNYNFDQLLNKINKGGLLVAPAASALTNISENKIYHNSLKKSDVAIFDSGFFCILLRFLKGKKVSKFSGYRFLKKFLNNELIKKKKILLIDPSRKDSQINRSYLKKQKIYLSKSYIAPIYTSNNIKDKKLIKIIKKYKPRYVIINIGGEIQEILGLYIKKNITFKSSIICTGAAIAFLTKRQAPINDLIDNLYLGWLLRTLFNPRKFFLRTIRSLSLIKQFYN